MRVKDFIDHLIWRMAQLLAVVGVLVFVVGFFLVRYLVGRRMPTPV